MAELNAHPERSGNKTRSKKAALRVDLTAMVDLAFLLITFFMLTTSLTKPKVMQINMPVGDISEPVGESRTMTICLGKNDKAVYYLGIVDKPLIAPVITNYSGSGLRHAILETGKRVKQTTGKSMMVIVKPSERSVYGNLVNTLDELNIAGVQQYAIADIAPKDIDLMKAMQAY